MNGYILETSNSKRVNNVNERLRSIFNKILKDEAVSKMASIFTPFVNYYSNEKADPKEHFDDCMSYLEFISYELRTDFFRGLVKEKLSKKGTLFDFSKKIIELISENNIRVDYNNSHEKIYFKTIGKVTLYYFAVSSENMKAFDKINKEQNILKDYCFYDNTDKPDDIKEKAWNHRRHTWERVLGRKHTISEVMFSIPISVDYYKIKETDVLQVLQDENVRLSSLYKRSRLNELVKTMTENHIRMVGHTPMSTSEHTNIYFEAAEQVNTEISEGAYLTSQKHLGMLISQDDFLNKIFYVDYAYYKVDDV